MAQFNPVDSKTSSRMISRRAAVAAISLPWFPAVSWAQQEPIVIGQSAALSGPLADLGRAMSIGAKVYFDALNARGGIKGRPVKLTTLDDAYDIKRSQANVAQLLQERGTLGLFNLMGTPMIEAAMPMLRSTGTMLFAPLSGALIAYPKDMRNVLSIRASYPDEAVQLVQHLSTIGIKKIALITQDNSFGDDVLKGALAAMRKQSLKPVAQHKVKNDSSDVAPAVSATAAASPEAVIIGLAGKPAIETIKALRAAQKGLSLYALSILGGAATIKAMGADGWGVTITQVVPMPTKEAIAVVREFRQAFAAAKPEIDASHLALEGFINAKTFATVASRVNGPITAKAIIDAAWAGKKLDLAGFDVYFSEPGKSASRFVELTMITRNGFVS